MLQTFLNPFSPQNSAAICSDLSPAISLKEAKSATRGFALTRVPVLSKAIASTKKRKVLLSYSNDCPERTYSSVTLFVKWRGLSISQPRFLAI